MEIDVYVLMHEIEFIIWLKDFVEKKLERKVRIEQERDGRIYVGWDTIYMWIKRSREECRFYNKRYGINTDYEFYMCPYNAKYDEALSDTAQLLNALLAISEDLSYNDEGGRDVLVRREGILYIDTHYGEKEKKFPLDLLTTGRKYRDITCLEIYEGYD